MTMPSSSRMPTIRSPGTAPPLGANLTGVSRPMPRNGSASPASDARGTRNTRSAAFGKPNQPLSFCGTAGPCLRSSLKLGNTARTTSVEKISPRPTPIKTSSIEARAKRDNAALSFASMNFLPARSNARSTIWRPSPPNCAFIAVVQFRNKRRDSAIDLRADRGIADVGVDRIGEVNRGRAAGQRDQPPLGGEAEHLVVKQLKLGVFEEFFRVVAGEGLDRLPQSAIGSALAHRQRVGAEPQVFIDAVRGDAVFSDFVHLVGADLQFDPLAARPDHRRVDRTIVVLLRRRDIILEAPGHTGPGRMRNADGGVTVGDGVDENTKAIDIGQLLEGDRAALHLAPDRIGLLLATLHL